MNKFPIFLILLVVASCKNDSNFNDTPSIIDTSKTISKTINDSIINNKLDSIIDEPIYEEKDLKKEEILLEKKYGVQWDFCDCIYKNDSINKVLQNTDNLSDEKIDQLFSRMDEIEAHCKSLITEPNTTPSDRKAHARKVRKCKTELGII